MWGILLALLHIMVGQALAMTNPTAADVSVMAVQAGNAVTAITPNGETLVTEHRYIGLDETTERVNTEIRFTGINADPGITVVVDIPDADIEQTTQATATGTWELSVPTTLLPVGHRYATVQYKAGDTFSAPLTVAEFEVKSAESLSSSTWLFLLSTTTAIVALLLAITIQLRYNLRHNPVL
ncbi:MAG: hypothetical protein ACD_43C00230G0002 [uncultured bacterium]|nr:MAG: hypothetical protein ACD_43C00230G0002 [uncultured bacterium]